MNHFSRDRVTVDLRGLGDRLRAHAVANHMSTAALMRRALSQLLDGDAGIDVACPPDESEPQGRVMKVTLRLPFAHAKLLARRARGAEVSQGTYVADLIDGTPPAPRATNHAEAVTALVGSTDQLAAIGVDLNALFKLLRRGTTPETQRYRDRVVSVADDVRNHLALASALIAELKATRRSR